MWGCGIQTDLERKRRQLGTRDRRCRSSGCGQSSVSDQTLSGRRLVPGPGARTSRGGSGHDQRPSAQPPNTSLPLLRLTRRWSALRSRFRRARLVTRTRRRCPRRRCSPSSLAAASLGSEAAPACCRCGAEAQRRTAGGRAGGVGGRGRAAGSAWDVLPSRLSCWGHVAGRWSLVQSGRLGRAGPDSPTEELGSSGGGLPTGHAVVAWGNGW